MIQKKQLLLDVVAQAVNQVNFQKGFATYKVKDDRVLAKLLPVSKNIVYGSLGGLKTHPLLHVLTYQVAVLACQLAILGDNEGDVLGHSAAPRCISFLDLHTD